MNEHYRLHNVQLPQGYMPSPGAHLSNHRDCEHYMHTLNVMMLNDYETILDVGSYDGWLPILLCRDGYQVTMLEFIVALADAAKTYKNVHKLDNLTILNAKWMDINITKPYDLITCYEVLEHVEITEAIEWIDKMDKLAKTVSISLPDQKHEENNQHRWTPSIEIIESLFGNKKNYTCREIEYPGTNIPKNFIITYETA